MMFFKKKKAKVKAVELTDANFDDIVMAENRPMLIDFWAPWCGPCKVMGPIVDELARELEATAFVAKINVDQNPKLSQHFQIRSIPTFLLVHNQQVVQRFQGMVPKPQLKQLLEELAAHAPVEDEEE
ncbi:MAG: thioredoxin [Saprospiraceae bacterium]|nr:thioredoxin [Saprospiraceae bacterium]